MPQHRLVISLNEGFIQDVLTDIPELEVIVCDWDVQGLTREDDEKLVEFSANGQLYAVSVRPMHTESLPTSPLSLVYQALRAAGVPLSAAGESER
jgi:hypothetical protein